MVPRPTPRRPAWAALACLASCLAAPAWAQTAGLPPGGLVLHLSADSLAASPDLAVLSSGWQDLSPRGNHAVPGVAPFHVVDAGDGQRAVRFNGLDAVLRAPVTLGAEVTVFAVFASKRSAPPADREDILLAAEGPSPRLALTTLTSQPVAPDYPTFAATPGDGITAETWVDGRRTSDATGDLFPNRFVLASAVFRGLPPTSALLLGAGSLAGDRPGRNDVRELVVYDRALGPAERRSVERLLALEHDLAIMTAEPTDPLEAYDLVLGSQQFGPGTSYGQTDNRIVNAAHHLYRQGSRTFKTRLSGRYAQMGDFDAQAGISDLAGLTRHPQVKATLDVPFRNHLFWVSTFALPSWQNRARATGAVPLETWRAFYGANRPLYAPGTYTDPAKAPTELQGLDPADAQREYREVYDLAAHLLRTYSGTGKRFYLGNWEGDWMLSNTGAFVGQSIPPERLQAMIDWANTRQRAIDDAKAATPHADVEVWYYVEMNKADWMRDGLICVANTVVPAMPRLDFISVSSYSIHKASDGSSAATSRVHSDLDRIRAAITPRAFDPDITGSRIIIGEYGFQLSWPFPTLDALARGNLNTARQYLSWPGGTIRFILQWQFFDEAGNPDTGTSYEFAQIDTLKNRRPSYHAHERFYRHMRRWLADRRNQDGVLPSAEAFEAEALSFLNSVALTEYRPVREFTRYQDWVAFNFPDTADRANAAVSGAFAAPDDDGRPNLLRYALGLDRGAPWRGPWPAAEIRGGEPHLVFPWSTARTGVHARVERLSRPGTAAEVILDTRTQAVTPVNGLLAVPIPGATGPTGLVRLVVGQ